MAVRGYDSDRFGRLRRSSGPLGFWSDYYISDDNQHHRMPVTGRYTLDFEDRSTEEERYFVFGVENGWRKRYWPGGALRERAHFVNDVRHGISESWHFSGHIASRSLYDKGSVRGNAERWSTTGEVQSASEDSEGTRHTIKEPLENDHTWLEKRGGSDGLYYDSRSGQLAEGVYTTSFDDGTIEAEVTFVGGLENGCRKKWWPDGRLRSESWLKDGFGHGFGESWHFNGQLARRRRMKNGCFVGVYETWFPTGQKNGQISYDEDGEYHGQEEYYDEDGDLSWTQYNFHGVKLWGLYGYELHD